MTKPSLSLSIVVSLVICSFFSTDTNANGIPAPEDTVKSLTAACENMAAEEQIEAIEKQQFITDCINAQLIEMGYQRQAPLEIEQSNTEPVEQELN
ncbi:MULTISPECIES: hypothetical protein [unclassified Shewanella]|uniref:hypothetical protein n=1 Tax=unclassified Shewanella TaxID=196818 RepID=UPI000C84941E|nr:MULTISPECIES: hypothetical protein [unclassified Shewanella]MDO6638867.1 hypothetical protein [Shewanella sp. 5_MG-2023]MDO6677223.1 hypothetical protein [Shewanella sp. 4_MG-2023]MDO6773885.1 hypothetical protein [Shewanella sp. 3_MG-2023]PMG31584.1 hypothetical protein BCU94_07580 [Shewanella sp. 10N.286.52.C2]PMG39472.1 hypothetical protein BCU91_15140 [Shewanella sp. 10N.286.52.B9]